MKFQSLKQGMFRESSGTTVSSRNSAYLERVFHVSLRWKMLLFTLCASYGNEAASSTYDWSSLTSVFRSGFCPETA